MGVHLQAAPTFWQCIECVSGSAQLANSQGLTEGRFPVFGSGPFKKSRKCISLQDHINLYQDIKVLTIYCSIIGNPISGQDTPVLQDIWVFM